MFSKRETKSLIRIQGELASLAQAILSTGCASVVATTLSPESQDGVHYSFLMVVYTRDIPQAVDQINRLHVYVDDLPPLVIPMASGDGDVVVGYGGMLRIAVTNNINFPIHRISTVLIHHPDRRITTL